MGARVPRWPVVIGVSLLALLPGCRRPLGSPSGTTNAPFSVEQVVERPGGPGVLIASPVPTTSDAELADFGDGAARWLQLCVGGHGEFGKTPEWVNLAELPGDLGRPRLRLRLDDRVRAAQLTGITHLALGEISGDQRHATLVYQLWLVPQLKAVGEPLRRTGSTKELLAQLPALADQLCLRLGVKTTTAPAQLTPKELAWLGRLSEGARALSPKEAEALELLGGDCALAAINFLFERARARDPIKVFLVGDFLARREPENALVLDAIAHALDRSYCKSPPGPGVQALQLNLARYPDNLCVHLAEAISQHAQHHYPAARAAAEVGVSCSPRSPFAWSVLGDMVGAAADEIQRGRFAGQMSSTEHQSIESIMREQLAIREKQLALCEFRPDSWVARGFACMHSGDSRRADESFQTAIKLDPNCSAAYWSGMELWASHWYSDPVRQKEYARRALQARFRTPEERMLVAKQVWTLVEMDWSLDVVPDPQEREQLFAWIRLQDPKYANVGKPDPKPGTKAAAQPPAYQILYSHNAAVWTIGWDPAGRQLATGGRDKVVKVWTASGSAPLELLGHQGSINVLTWSPDGRQLATAGEESLIRIWNPAAGSTVRTIPGKCGVIRGLSWTRAGNRLAFGGTDGTVHIWDMTQDREQRVLRYGAAVVPVAWSPDGTQLAAAGKSGIVRVWDAATGKERYTLSGPALVASGMAWRADGRQLAATSVDGTIWVWNTPAGTTATVFRGVGGIPTNLTWSADGRWIASGGEMPDTTLWDVRGKRRLRTLRGHDEGFNAVAWSRSGRLASGGGNRDVVLWEKPLAGVDTRLR